jgi:uracil-DNA glycosylase
MFFWYTTNMRNSMKLPQAWKPLLSTELKKDCWKTLTASVREAYEHTTVFPPSAHLFRALSTCGPGAVKVVILGQDPYHTPGVADGLAFSTLPGNKVPPSLQNIFKEIAEEYDTMPSKNPDLTRWATQGVLLLNTSLSVESGEANSHAHLGWHEFTDTLIRALSQKQEHIVFLLLGAFAQRKEALIDASRHLILKAPHPSPLSAHRGFLGCGHFKVANEYLTEHGRGEIDWR